MKSYQVLNRLFSITMVLCLCLTVSAIPGKKKEKKFKGDVGTTISLVTTGSGDYFIESETVTVSTLEVHGVSSVSPVPSVMLILMTAMLIFEFDKKNSKKAS